MRLPLPLMKKYLANARVLKAEDTLSAIQVAAYPYMEKGDRKSFVNALEEAARSTNRVVYTKLDDFKNFLARHGVLR